MIFWKNLPVGEVFRTSFKRDREKSDPLTFSAIGPVVHFVSTHQQVAQGDDAISENSVSRTPEIRILQKQLLPDIEAQQFEDMINMDSDENEEEKDEEKNSARKSGFQVQNFISTQTLKKDELATSFSKISNNIQKLGEMNRTSVRYARKLRGKRRLVNGKTIPCIYEKREDFLENQLDYLTRSGTEDIDSISKMSREIDDSTWLLIRHFNYADRLAAFFQKRTHKNIIQYCSLFCFLPLLAFLYQYCRKIFVAEYGGGPVEVIPNLVANLIATPMADWRLPSFSNSADLALMGLVTVLVLHLALTLVTLVVFCMSSWCAYYQKFHQYRALAEGMRVQIYWRIAGMDDVTPGNYRAHQVPEIAWLRIAMTGVDVFLDSPQPMGQNKNSNKHKAGHPSVNQCVKEVLRFRLINILWIAGQLNYLLGSKSLQKEFLAQKKRTDASSEASSETEPSSSSEHRSKVKRMLGAIKSRQNRSTGILRGRLFPVVIALALILVASRCYWGDLAELVQIWTSGMSQSGIHAWAVLALQASGIFIASLVSAMIVYRRLMLFDLEGKMLQQLVFPCRRANILLHLRCEKAEQVVMDRLLSYFLRNPELAEKLLAVEAVATTENAWDCVPEEMRMEIGKKMPVELKKLSPAEVCEKLEHAQRFAELMPDFRKENHQTLRELGQITLGKSADWLLAMSKRRLILPR